MIIDGVRIPLPIGWTDEDVTPSMLEEMARTMAARRLAAAPPPAFGPEHPPPPEFTRDPDKVNVFLVSPCSGIGGAERWIGDIMDHCDGSKLHFVGVGVFWDRGGPSMRREWEEHCPVGVGHGSIRAGASLADVLLTWGVLDLPWSIPTATFAELVPRGVPLVSVSHGAIGYAEHIDPSNLSHATPVAVSTAALSGVPRSKRDGARVIRNTVSIERVKPRRPKEEVRRSLGIPHGVEVVGWLGRLSPEKRPEVFVDAFAHLPANWWGVMAGPGVLSHTKEVADRIERVAPGRILQLGAREDVGDLLSIFDCLVMPSQTEACSIAAIEAWWTGTPMIGTRVGELIENPGLARLLPENPTGDDVAAAILADDRDRGGTHLRALRARDFARSRYSPDRFGREWTDFLCSVGRPMETHGNSRQLVETFHVKGPSMIDKAVSFTKAVVKHVAAGCPTRTEERQAELKAVCLSCLYQVNEASKCSKCGCSGMNLKRSMKKEVCPLSMWPPDE